MRLGATGSGVKELTEIGKSYSSDGISLRKREGGLEEIVPKSVRR
jgi:hypothetical protein